MSFPVQGIPPPSLRDLPLPFFAQGAVAPPPVPPSHSIQMISESARGEGATHFFSQPSRHRPPIAFSAPFSLLGKTGEILSFHLFAVLVL